jgi:hypothetical protein
MNNNHQNKNHTKEENAKSKVTKKMEKWDQDIREAQKTKAVPYGTRTADTAKVKYSEKESNQIVEAYNQSKEDRYIPDFTKIQPLMPERSNLYEVPVVRYSPSAGGCFNDMNQKLIYVHKPGEWFRIGKEMPATQPVITHEFVEDALFAIADKNKEEFEIMRDQTYHDKKGYRRYWGVLSRRLDTEIKDSFRTGDVVRFGAMVRNGINEQTSVGFDMFSYAIKCLNGSIGRSKELGSEAWKHTGPAEDLQTKILAGLNEMFDMGEAFVENILVANKTKMIPEHIKQIYQKTDIADKYYDEQYFTINSDVKMTDKDRITLVDKGVTLWEGYNAITAQVWHSEDIAFGKKSKALRQLNEQLVQIVQTKRPK